MSQVVDAAEDILRSTFPPVDEWKLEREIRDTTRSDVEVPSRQEVLIENLRDIRDSYHVRSDCDIRAEVDELIDLLEEWPEEQLEEIRDRVRDLARKIVDEGGL